MNSAWYGLIGVVLGSVITGGLQLLQDIMRRRRLKCYTKNGHFI